MKTKRVSVGKKLRFDVFHRDSFTCQYCGSTPPKVILHVDHIVPVASGGTSILENLITSCQECNSGKSAKNLDRIPKDKKKIFKELKEKRAQLEAFYNNQKIIELATEWEIDSLNKFWTGLTEGEYSLNNYGRASIRLFLKDHSVSEIKDAMALARQRVPNVHGSFKYMCGILNNIKRDRNG
jgi:hypothetical protein